MSVKSKALKPSKLEEVVYKSYQDVINKKLKAGIYREVPDRNGKFIARALFYFGTTPRQKGKVTFSQRIKKIADKRVFKYWVSETRKLARKRK